MTEKKQVNCVDCLRGIERLDVKLEILNKSIMKILYALLGVVGANIGTRYIGTPWYVYTAMYIYLAAGIFVVLTTIKSYKFLNRWQKAVRYFFVMHVFYSYGLRVYHYSTNTPLTQLEGVFANLLMAGLGISIAGVVWCRWGGRLKHLDKSTQI